MAMIINILKFECMTNSGFQLFLTLIVDKKYKGCTWVRLTFDKIFSHEAYILDMVTQKCESKVQSL